MIACDFTQKQIDELNKLIKKAIRDKRMHGRQASDERLYFNVEEGGRGPKSMEDVQEDTKVRVACYMASQNRPLDQSSIRY